MNLVLTIPVYEKKRKKKFRSVLFHSLENVHFILQSGNTIADLIIQ